MKRISLTQGKFALVDDADYEWLSQWKWHVKKASGIFYAVRVVYSRENKKRIRKRVRMHNLIMKPKNGLFVDHIDGNGLNNQRINLRVCSQANNNRNKKGWSKTGYKGVYEHNKKWQASLTKNYTRIHLGTFDTPEDAARAYDKAAKEHFGEFVSLNFQE